jgi:hypothetical protein
MTVESSKRVLDQTDRVCKGSLSSLKLELDSEGEYVFDTANSLDSFFYNKPTFVFAVGLTF